MKRFRFRLERVLNFRESEKKERERELKQRNSELVKAEQERDGVMKAQDVMSLVGEGEYSVGDFEIERCYREFLNAQLVQNRLLVMDAQTEVERARDSYIEKAIETEMLEKLKERRFDEFREERAKNERKNLSELTTMRHRLKRD